MRILSDILVSTLIVYVAYIFIYGTPHKETVNVIYVDNSIDSVNVGEQPEDFYNVLGFYESTNNYHRVNSLGYLGKYQFSLKTLNWIGIKTTKSEFLNNPKLQEYAVRKYVEVNKRLLKSYIAKYSNKYFITINGEKIFVTESGILAGAHLGGHNSVKKFFDTAGKINHKDANGTSIKRYIEQFNNLRI